MDKYFVCARVHMCTQFLKTNINCGLKKACWRLLEELKKKECEKTKVEKEKEAKILERMQKREEKD